MNDPVVTPVQLVPMVKRKAAVPFAAVMVGDVQATGEDGSVPDHVTLSVRRTLPAC